ncbi:MAG: fasciclin domain-containing protein, partial [Gemmataceae bacterium]
VPGKVLARQLAGVERQKTLLDVDVRVDVTDGVLTINSSRVLKTDVRAENGVIHVIDRVLLPEAWE